MPQENFINHFVTVDPVLDRFTNIHVIVRRNVRQHRHGILLVARHFLNAQCWVCFQQAFGFEIDPVNRINLTCHQGIHARSVIVNRNVFDFTEETGAIAFVVV